jgi:hypothetical protein
VRKVLTEKDRSPASVDALNKECIEILISAMRHMQRRHDISVPSAHLMFISRLIGFVQSIDPVSTDAMLRGFSAIHADADDPVKLEAANAELGNAQDKLLLAFDLFYARPENGGHA